MTSQRIRAVLHLISGAPYMVISSINLLVLPITFILQLFVVRDITRCLPAKIDLFFISILFILSIATLWISRNDVKAGLKLMSQNILPEETPSVMSSVGDILLTLFIGGVMMLFELLALFFNSDRGGIHFCR